MTTTAAMGTSMGTAMGTEYAEMTTTMRLRTRKAPMTGCQPTPVKHNLSKSVSCAVAGGVSKLRERSMSL
jgi:hypothetical protein